MGLINSLKLKKATRYGLVKQGKYYMSEIAFEKDLGEKNINSENLIFLKENIIVCLPLGYKIIGYESINNIAEYQNYPKQPDGTALLTLIYKSGEKTTIQFATNKLKLSFLYKLQNIQNNKSDLIKEIENIE